MMIATLLEDENISEDDDEADLDGGVLQLVPERAEQPLKRMPHKYHCHT